MNARRNANEPTQRTPTSARVAGVGGPSIRLAALLLAAFLLALTLAFAPRAEAYVYWIDEHIDPDTSEFANTTIERANLDGTGVKRDLVVLPPGVGGGGMALDEAHLYWTTTDEPLGNEPSIGRVNLDGSAPDESFIGDVSGANGVAVDDEHIYWGGAGTIGRANLDGTGVDESFITGLEGGAWDLTVNGSHIYWINMSPGSNLELYGGPNRIGRARLDGTGVDEEFIDWSPWIYGVAVDNTHVWWAHSGRFDGAIVRANLNGTGVEWLIGGEDIFPCGVAVNDTHVYWSDPSLIGRARLDGSRAIPGLISRTDNRLPCPLAVDALGPPPADDFHLGKVKKNRRTGTAKLTVSVPGPGELDLAKTKKVKADDELAEAASREKLRVKPKGKARKRLNTKGKAKVKAKVTYTPAGGEPNTKSKRILLRKRF